ncbi:GntR family transcriptional regulator [Mycolicibacterium komossense]|uniref:GntR family transcriptional regulator n=1 Tax=Mycolicibacterium komossense TaxID=1779 RepID=A0ABT3C739_9MYCO|nr:GntR family transcriptional regulator [Mycolicibacterium komossense]MCV7225299.1 GntR family transcriptional regulator [Mycolicibacterium komossense]
MPKIYGVMEKDLVVMHILGDVFSGKLRAGDRIDRNELAKNMGLSRVPIQEAMVQLEHDGVIVTRYHRGAFVERFDEATIREHHEIYGQLNGLAAARAAADLNSSIVERLDEVVEMMRSATDAGSFQEAVGEYRRVICDAYAGPRLSALIRTTRSFIPPDFWRAYLAVHAEFVASYETETDAIRRHDVDGARVANMDRSTLLATIMLAELSQRGVIKVNVSLESGRPLVAH